MKEWIENHLNIDLHKAFKQKKKEMADIATSSGGSTEITGRARSKSKISSVMPFSSQLSIQGAQHASGNGSGAVRRSVMGNFFIDSHKVYETDYHVSSLVVEIIEAKNLIGKDISGTSDVSSPSSF